MLVYAVCELDRIFTTSTITTTNSATFRTTLTTNKIFQSNVDEHAEEDAHVGSGGALVSVVGASVIGTATRLFAI